MRICLIGKYPPIQGGVSARTFHMAHGLAARGHEVHVVTNAREVERPWRLFMREEDWSLCEADYGKGSVRVSWTEPVDWRQRYIPRNNPSVTKLVSLALATHGDKPFDIVHSYYLEPYAVAGHLLATTLDLPHVVKTAGSDVGKLWRHPQLEPLYDEILQSADLFFAAGVTAARAIEHGVDPRRIIANRGFQLSTDLFHPDAPPLDLAALAREIANSPAFESELWGSFVGNQPYIGVYGKLGEKKGSFALVEALAQARSQGAELGLVAMAHGHPETETAFRGLVERLGLEDRVLQIPFLPHWRVPSFINSCRAVCCLEQDFPIKIHNPIVTDEVMSCGTLLVASTELLAKQTHGGHLVDGVNCRAVRDTYDTAALAGILADIARMPEACRRAGARGRDYIERFDRQALFAARAEYLLEKVLESRPLPPALEVPAGEDHGPASLTSLALSLLTSRDREACLASCTSEPETPEWVGEVRKGIDRLCPPTDTPLESIAAAIDIDWQIRSVRAGSEDELPAAQALFRASSDGFIDDAGDLSDLRPRVRPDARILAFGFDIGPYVRARRAEDLPSAPPEGSSHLIVLPGEPDSNTVIQIGKELAAFLVECDGVRTCAQLANATRADLADLTAPLIALLIDDAVRFCDDELAGYASAASTRS